MSKIHPCPFCGNLNPNIIETESENPKVNCQTCNIQVLEKIWNSNSRYDEERFRRLQRRTQKYQSKSARFHDPDNINAENYFFMASALMELLIEKGEYYDINLEYIERVLNVVENTYDFNNPFLLKLRKLCRIKKNQLWIESILKKRKSND